MNRSGIVHPDEIQKRPSKNTPIWTDVSKGAKGERCHENDGTG